MLFADIFSYAELESDPKVEKSKSSWTKSALDSLLFDGLLVEAVDGLLVDDLLVDGLLVEDAIVKFVVVLGDDADLEDFVAFLPSKAAGLCSSRVFDLVCFALTEASLSPLNASRLAW
jgi:hypothetical protein